MHATVEKTIRTNQFLGEVWVKRKGLADLRPLTPRRSWLRGLDLNQRPLGYEYNTAMSGNPLILQERRSPASGSTLSDDASFFVSFHPVSGCYGSKMGAEIRDQSPRLSAASGRRALRSRSSERERALDDRLPARVGQVSVGDTKPRHQLPHGR